MTTRHVTKGRRRIPLDWMAKASAAGAPARRLRRSLARRDPRAGAGSPRCVAPASLRCGVSPGSAANGKALQIAHFVAPATCSLCDCCHTVEGLVHLPFQTIDRIAESLPWMGANGGTTAGSASEAEPDGANPPPLRR